MIGRLFLRCFFLVLVTVGCESKKTKKEIFHNLESKATLQSNSGGISVYNFDDLAPIFNYEDDKIYVINFWATWCLPCIKELPYFEQINAEEKENGVEVVLISLDMPSIWESRLIPFVEEHKLKSHVIVLDDPKQNTWIPKVNKDWSGAIPATVIYNKNKKVFYEQSFTYQELINELNKFKK